MARTPYHLYSTDASSGPFHGYGVDLKCGGDLLEVCRSLAQVGVIDV